MWERHETKQLDPHTKEISNIDKSSINYFDKISKVLKNHIFTFFNYNELRKISMVSKNFNQLGRTAINKGIEKYKDNIFYMIGGGINISDENESLYRHRIVYRKNISNKEISESFLLRNKKELRVFNNTDTICLFKTENDAIQYANFLKEQEWVGETCEHSAVFRIIYLGDRNKLREDRVGYKDCNATFSKCELDMITPLDGTLKIKQVTSKELLTFGPVECSSIGFLDEKKQQISNYGCNIL